jgi:WD40 repeat protein
VALSLSHDGKIIATAHTNLTVQLWSLSSRQRLLEPWRARAPVGKLVFAPHGRQVAFSIVSRNTESEVQVRSVATGALVASIAHRNELTDFEYSRDGRRIVTGSEDRTARVWDAATGEAISPWLIHQYEIQAVQFAPDGERIVTLGTRGLVRLWNASTGEPLTASFDFNRDNGGYRAQFSPDGLRLLFTTGAKKAWILDLQPERATLDELKLRAMVYSCMRLDPSGGVAPVDNETLNRAWGTLRAAR